MNTAISVIPVRSRREMNDFIHIVDRIYKDSPQYVPDLESDIREFFDIKTNPGLEFSDVQAWVAYRGQESVGRIVGIINRHANEKWKVQNVRFSMIEFIDDLEVSKALLDAVAKWGRDHGMTALQGPLGITDFDKEGMLVEDFHLTGTMSTIYNPDYYPRHMEALGFQKEADWVQIRVTIPKEVPDKYVRVAQFAKQRLHLRVIKPTMSDIKKRGLGQKIFDLLNQAYSPLFGYSELSPKQVELFINKYLSLIDLRMVPIIMNDKDEVVGAAITMGCLSHAMQKAHGRLLPFGWFHLLKALKWKNEGSAEMLLIAVRPDLQAKGVNALFFDDLIRVYNQQGIHWAETGPQLEYNTRELTQWEPMSPEFVKRRRCYVKVI